MIHTEHTLKGGPIGTQNTGAREIDRRERKDSYTMTIFQVGQNNPIDL